MTMQADHLIIGQGICGTLLSRELINSGSSVIVIDPGVAPSASRAAGGIINPVTGKRLVNSWMVDTLMPFAWDTYQQIGKEINATIIKKCDILDFYATLDVRSVFTDRKKEGNEYLDADVKDDVPEQYFRYNYGYGKIAPAMLLDINAMLAGWRHVLEMRGSLVQETFAINECEIDENGVSYRNIRAKKVIFCDGVSCKDNPYFDILPWAQDKGEALVASIPGLPAETIYRQGSISIVPWQNELFWIGATHDWKFTDMEPTEAFRKRVEEQLSYWLKLPFTITDHLVAQRPANMDRKPFVGIHPMHPSIGIFNGMGGKGCMQAPYFAHKLRNHLLTDKALPAEVDIIRYNRILSR